jgi:hypothetical protein
MKAEQRKKLEQNELVTRLTNWWKGDADKKVSGTTWAIVGLIVLVGLLIFAWRYYAETASKNQSAHWGDLQTAGEISQLEQLVEANRGTATARSAKAQMARGWLQDGLSKLGSENFRTAAIENVEKARNLYTELSKEVGDDVQLQREVLFALAKAEESLVGIPKSENAVEDRGSLDKALEHYDRLAEAHKESIQGKVAAERAEDIKKNKAAILAFYKELGAGYAKSIQPKLPELPPIVPPKVGLPEFSPPNINPPKVDPLKIDPPSPDPAKTPKSPAVPAKKDEGKSDGTPAAPPPTLRKEVPKKDDKSTEPSKDSKK